MSAIFSGDVLVVEDNIIIAMDAEDVLATLGAARVHSAANVAQARDLIGSESIEAAILDYNLDGETSEAVADQLRSDGTPFVFATGYSGLEELPARFADCQLLQKPYSAEDIRAAFAVTRADPASAA